MADATSATKKKHERYMLYAAAGGAILLILLLVKKKNASAEEEGGGAVGPTYTSAPGTIPAEGGAMGVGASGEIEGQLQGLEASERSWAEQIRAELPELIKNGLTASAGSGVPVTQQPPASILPLPVTGDSYLELVKKLEGRGSLSTTGEQVGGGQASPSNPSSGEVKEGPSVYTPPHIIDGPTEAYPVYTPPHIVAPPKVLSQHPQPSSPAEKSLFGGRTIVNPGNPGSHIIAKNGESYPNTEWNRDHPTHMRKAG